MTGRGGWPMTVFLTPDGRAVLRRHLLPEAAVPAADGAPSTTCGATGPTTSSRTSSALARGAAAHGAASQPADRLPGHRRSSNAGLQQLADAFDPEWGGFGGAPKFPSTMSLDLLLARLPHGTARRRRRDHASPPRSTPWPAAASTTTSAAASPATRSTREWLVPHFEKMLYDQALLVRVYLHAVAGDSARPR